MTEIRASIVWSLFGGGYAERRYLLGILHATQLVHPHALLDQNDVDGGRPRGVGGEKKRVVSDPYAIDQPSADLFGRPHGLSPHQQSLASLKGHDLTPPLISYYSSL